MKDLGALADYLLGQWIEPEALAGYRLLLRLGGR